MNYELCCLAHKKHKEVGLAIFTLPAIHIPTANGDIYKSIYMYMTIFTLLPICVPTASGYTCTHTHIKGKNSTSYMSVSKSGILFVNLEPIRTLKPSTYFIPENSLYLTPPLICISYISFICESNHHIFMSLHHRWLI